MGSMGSWRACSFGDAIHLLLLYTKDTQHDAAAAAAVGLLPCRVKTDSIAGLQLGWCNDQQYFVSIEKQMLPSND